MGEVMENISSILIILYHWANNLQFEECLLISFIEREPAKKVPRFEKVGISFKSIPNEII